MNIHDSCGNVFADLECKNPSALLLQANLMIALRDLAQRRQWSTQQMGQQLNISTDQAHQMLYGSINDFTLEEIIEVAAHAGIHTEVRLPHATANL